jgi:glucokinase
MPAVGIDLGGTKIQAGVVAADGSILSKLRVPTEAHKDTATVARNMQTACREALAQAGLAMDEVAGVGVGSPGPMDIVRGVLISPVNLPSLHGFPLVDELARALETRVVLNNDANCFGLGEARFGAGSGAGVCCGFTLGTGLGGFMVLDGVLFNGPRGAGVEIWCSPYRGDHVEEKVSGRGLVRNYKKLTGATDAPAGIAAKARDGEPAAQEAWKEFGRDLAVPIAYLSNVLDADVVVLGGSLSKAWDLFSPPMLSEAAKYTNEVTRDAVRIVPAELGDDAGMIGAAALVLDTNN